MLAKLQGYIKCLDGPSARVFALADLVRGADALPAIHPLDDPDECVRVIVTSSKREPHVPELEAEAEAYRTALAGVIGATAATTPERAALLAAFDRFDAAQSAFFDDVHRRNHAIVGDQLARRTKRDGNTVAVIGDTLAFEAEDIVRLAAIHWDHLDQLDIAAMQPELATFRRGVDDLHAAYIVGAPDKDETKRVGTSAESAQKFLAACEQLVMRARDHVPFTDGEKLELATHDDASVPGTPAAVVAAYNRFIGEPLVAIPTEHEPGD